MKPGTQLGEFFTVMASPNDAARLQDLHYTLDELDEYLGGLPLLESAPPVVARLANGDYRTDEGTSAVVLGGDASGICITPPYDVIRHPTDPTLIMASRLLAFTIAPRPRPKLVHLVTGKPAGAKEAATDFYLFGMQLDGVQHHEVAGTSAEDSPAQDGLHPDRDDTAGGMAMDQPSVASTITLNPERFIHLPPASAYQVGIARRAGELCLFTFVPNERHGGIIPTMAGTGSVFSSDGDRAEFGPLDNQEVQLRTLGLGDGEGRLVLDVIAEIRTLLESQPLQTPTRRRWYALGRGKPASRQ